MDRQMRRGTNANLHQAMAPKINLPLNLRFPMADIHNKLGPTWNIYGDIIKNIVCAGRQGYDATAWFDQAAEFVRGRPDLEISHEGILLLLSEMDIRPTRGNTNSNHMVSSSQSTPTAYHNSAPPEEMEHNLDDENEVKPLGTNTFHNTMTTKSSQNGRMAMGEQNSNGMQAGDNHSPPVYHSPMVNTALRNELNGLAHPSNPPAHAIGTLPVHLEHSSQMPVAPSQVSATNQANGSTFEGLSRNNGKMPPPLHPSVIDPALTSNVPAKSVPGLNIDGAPEIPEPRLNIPPLQVQRFHVPMTAPTPSQVLNSTLQSQQRPFEASGSSSEHRSTAMGPPPPKIPPLGDFCTLFESPESSDAVETPEAYASYAQAYAAHHSSTSSTPNPQRARGQHQGFCSIGSYGHATTHETPPSPFVAGATDSMMFRDPDFTNDVRDFFQPPEDGGQRSRRNFRSRDERIPYGPEEDDLAVFRRRCGEE